MPLLNIHTNVSVADKTAFALRASAYTAKAIGKPESYVMVQLEDERTLVFAGSDQPAAYLELKSIGLPEQRTAELSAALCELISTELGINGNRIYIEFSNAARHMWGWDGATF